MKRLCSLLLLLLTGVCGLDRCLAQDSQLKSLATAIAGRLGAAKKTIAVVDFTDLQGNVTELGRFLAEELSVALAGSDLQVIDRNHLKVILEENKLGRSGVIDQATVRKLGQIAGVDTLITGSLTPLGDVVRLSAKAMDSATARIVWATSIDVPKTKAIEALLERSVGSGNSSGGDGPMAGGTAFVPPQSAPALRMEVSQFLFEVKSCTRRGGDVICSLTITNMGEDGEIGLSNRGSYGDTRLFDNLGEEYTAADIRVGSHSGTLIEVELISGVATNASIRFPNVSPAAERVAALEISGYARNGYVNVKIRNIVLSR